MEILQDVHLDEPSVRTYTIHRTKVRKDGTVAKYQVIKKYTPKTSRVHYGKAELRSAITECNDKEKIQQLRAFMIEAGILVVTTD